MGIVFLILTTVALGPVFAQMPRGPSCDFAAIASHDPDHTHTDTADTSISIGSEFGKAHGNVVVAKGQTVREATAVKGNVTVYGHVTGDASAVMGNVDVKSGGKVDGDATAVMGNVIVRSGGSVSGDATTVMGGVIHEVGGTIGGSKTSIGPSMPHWTRGWFGGLGETGGLLFFGIVAGVVLIAQVLVAVLLVALFPQRMATVAECSLTRPGWSALYGIAGVMAAVPVAILLLVTCVGIPLIGVEAILLYAMWVVGAAGIKLAVGQKLGEAVNKPLLAPVWAAVVGAVVLGLVRLIPFVGSLIVHVLFVFGFGAVIMTGFGSHPDWFSRRFSKTAPTQPTPVPPADAPQAP